MLERNLPHIDAFIAKSRFSRDKHREFGFGRDMEVMPYFLPDRETDGASEDGRAANGAAAVSFTEADSPHARPYFLFVGRLEQIKGLQDVIPAFAEYSAADLLIAGDGDYEHALRRLATDVPAVHFLGRVTPAALRRYYGSALALIVPSLCYETFGIILIEAFREGTPVIARRIGPFPEILGTCPAGELFSTRSELVAAMRSMQSDAGRRARLKNVARDGFRTHWSEEAVLPLYLDIVRRAAERRGQHQLATALAAGSRSWSGER